MAAVWPSPKLVLWTPLWKEEARCGVSCRTSKKIATLMQCKFISCFASSFVLRIPLCLWHTVWTRIISFPFTMTHFPVYRSLISWQYSTSESFSQQCHLDLRLCSPNCPWASLLIWRSRSRFRCDHFVPFLFLFLSKHTQVERPQNMCGPNTPKDANTSCNFMVRHTSTHLNNAQQNSFCHLKLPWAISKSLSKTRDSH